MAGKTKSMSQIKQLIILHRQGSSVKSIARVLSMSKNTVKSYLSKLSELSKGHPERFTTEQIKTLEDPELYYMFHPGNPAYKDNNRYDQFKELLEYFMLELQRTGVTRHLLWEEYRQTYPQGYSYTQFCFHLDQHKKAKRKTSAPLKHAPAEKLHIDFAGKTIPYVDHQTGELIPCQLFVACLPFSDYAFAMAVPSQKIDDFLHALACCLAFLGGVPMTVVPDNLKSAVIKADRYDPDINKSLLSFANHYQMAVVPARALKPQDKASVENQVKILYTRIYGRLRNRSFFDLASLNEAIKGQIIQHNQTRMKRKPYCREELFLSQEKHLLSPLPEHHFELNYHFELTLSKNNHLYVTRDKHYYSAPYTLIGQKLSVICTRSMVYVYHKGMKVATHVRGVDEGGYTTVDEHLCPNHQQYRGRSAEYYQGLANEKSAVIGQFMDLLLKTKRYPELMYRSGEGLLSLTRITDMATLEQACLLAINNGEISLRFIKNVLKNHTSALVDETVCDKPLPKHNQVRGPDYYQQIASSQNSP